MSIELKRNGRLINTVGVSVSRHLPFQNVIGIRVILSGSGQADKITKIGMRPYSDKNQNFFCLTNRQKEMHFVLLCLGLVAAQFAPSPERQPLPEFEI